MSGSMSIMDDFGLGLVGPPATNGDSSSSIPSLVAYNKNSLSLNLDFVRAPGSLDVTINMTATNSGNSEITDFVFQAAVPKSFSLSLQPPSGNQIAAFGLGSVTQSMLIRNPTKQQLKLRLRLQFTKDGSQMKEIEDVSNIPEAAWR